MDTAETEKAPTSFKVEIYFLSRDYRVLFGLVAVIVLAGVLLAMKMSGSAMTLEQALWTELDPSRIVRPLEQLEETLTEGDGQAGHDDVRANEVALLLRAVDAEDSAEEWERAMEIIRHAKVSAARQQLYLEFGQSMRSLTREPNATLLTLAYREQLPAANYLTALLLLRKEENDRAREFMHREGRFSQSSLARSMEITMALKARDLPALEKLAADPDYAREWSPAAETTVAVEKRDWLGALGAIFRHQWGGLDPGILRLALISGGIWFLIWLQAIQVREALGARMTLCIMAFLLGVLSTTPTLLMVVGSERYLGLVEGQGFWSDVGFYMLGVGPREEFCKWLAMLPLVPALLRRGSRLEMLVVPGFVGLGFAVTENFGYFSEYASSAYVRFLTANFLHVAATGLVGWSFLEALSEPRRWWVFPLVFLEVAALHGIYDVFIAIEVLAPLQIISSIAFIYLALRFFRRLRLYRSLETNYFWMPTSIMLGLAVVMAATLVEASSRTGFAPAMVVLGYHSLTFVMLVYLFVWQTRNLRYDADL